MGLAWSFHYYYTTDEVFQLKGIWQWHLLGMPPCNRCPADSLVSSTLANCWLVKLHSTEASFHDKLLSFCTGRQTVQSKVNRVIDEKTRRQVQNFRLDELEANNFGKAEARTTRPSAAYLMIYKVQKKKTACLSH